MSGIIACRNARLMGAHAGKCVGLWQGSITVEVVKRRSVTVTELHVPVMRPTATTVPNAYQTKRYV